MDPEKEPLIKLSIATVRNYSSSDASSGRSEGTSCDFNLSVFGEDEYKTDTRNDAATHSENITLTWSRIDAFAYGASSSWSWRDVGRHAARQGTEKKQILFDVSGVARPGELLAVMGSSGAGKTTLLNVLTSRCPPGIAFSGTVRANGIAADADLLTSRSAYVQQDDLFVGSLTVKEHLIFQALLRMDPALAYQQKLARVEAVIVELGLNDCKDAIIALPSGGGNKTISGGESKRLSFAAQVLTDPVLMFCDEPTSGLDSFTASNVAHVLKKLARKGKTVVCTIHQPSSEIYGLFDKILLMAEGRVAFLGKPDEASHFFASLEAPCPHNFNPADYFLQLLAVSPGREESCKQAVNMICDRFERSVLGVRVVVEASTVSDEKAGRSGAGGRRTAHGKDTSRYKASWCAQFRAVLWRSWLGVTREPLLIKVRLIQTAVVALLVGVVYYGQVLDADGVINIDGALFIFLTTMTFQNVFAVVHVFCAELPILLRENKNGMYRTDVYFLCKTVSEMPFFAIVPVLFVGVCYYLIGLNPRQPRFVVATVILILVANVAVSFGYFVSCLSSSVSMALSLAPPLIIPFLLFGGFFLNVVSVPGYLEWIARVSWFRYGNEALMINQWQDVDSIDCDSGAEACPTNGHVVLEMYNFSEDNFIMDVVALTVLMCGFRLLAYVALYFKTCKYE